MKIIEEIDVLLLALKHLSEDMPFESSSSRGWNSEERAHLISPRAFERLEEDRMTIAEVSIHIKALFEIRKSLNDEVTIIADIGVDPGGYDHLSELEKQLIRRAASLSIMAEAIEGDLVGEKPVDIDRYGAICDRLGRIAQRLGLSRLARDVGNDERSLADMFRRAEPVADLP